VLAFLQARYALGMHGAAAADSAQNPAQGQVILAQQIARE